MIGNVTIAGSVNDLNTFMSYRSKLDKKIKIVVISDSTFQFNNCIVGSILLPSSDAMFDLVEGNHVGFTQKYFNKLDYDIDTREYLIVLLAGLIEYGTDYCFFFNSDDPTIWNPIANALSEYLDIRFGIKTMSVYTALSYPNGFFISSITDQYKLYNDYELIRQNGLINQNTNNDLLSFVGG